MINFEHERRGSRSRTLERSLSYSEAIGNHSGRSSIEIPRIVDTDVYTNEDLKKQYRISQTYVEGKEIAFIPYSDAPIPATYGLTDNSIYSSEEDHYEQIDRGLVMTIDVGTPESPKSDGTKNTSEATTRPMVSSSVTSDIYDTIETAESLNTDNTGTGPSSNLYTSPLTRRKRTRKHRRQHGRPVRSRRVVFKDGEENVPLRSNIPAKSIKYMRDIVNTVINSKWRFIILMMILAHFLFWLLFAGIWYAVSRSYQEDIGDGKDHCVIGTSSFAGLLMMSVETQMTIGYGVRYPSEECPEAIIVMVLEIVAGTALSGGLSSLLFTKLVRPDRHVSSVGFSKKATICLRDGELTLQFRVWDLLNLHLVNTNITAYILKPIRTLEGELVQNYIQQLKLKQARAFLLWPITVVHVIDAESPLFDFSAQDMMDYRFEIVVCLTGSSKSMGTVTQSRTSYLSKEIIWGFRFQNVLKYSKRQESYVIDMDKLNSVEQVETPLCSSSTLKDLEVDIKASRNMLSTPTNISVSPIDLNYTREDLSTFSKAELADSLPSSPSFSRTTGTQRSFGWNFRRNYQPERVDSKPEQMQ